MRFLREPLVHFLLLGALLFGVHALISGEAPRRDVVVVTRGRIDGLVAQFAATHGRPPDTAERSGLIQDWVREEILCREAVALGLDREDAVIRDRLRQKMEFVSGGDDATPESRDARYRDIARRYAVTIEDAPAAPGARAEER
ncbi:MAG TPA: hypothetical protein VGS03_04775 [Candidatus Polarisedimenticolia bacterium]|nr:hypothetical protein [Candidatus Polarisedimenticolia bacterium]